MSGKLPFISEAVFFVELKITIIFVLAHLCPFSVSVGLSAAFSYFVLFSLPSIMIEGIDLIVSHIYCFPY